MTAPKPKIVVHHDYKLYGGMADFHRDVFTGQLSEETLLEGPSRTGKSLGIGLTLSALCEKYPGISVLLVRKTLKSMRDTVLTTLEDEVLPPKHPALKSFNRYSQQPRYEYPNGSKMVCTGCAGPEDVQRIKSSQWNVIWVNEATEITLNDWEIMLTRMSARGLPTGNFAVVDCNPDAPQHWLNQRASKGVMRRIKTTLDDNPYLVDPATGKYTEAGTRYLRFIDQLTGVNYQRYRKGLWVAAEGAIWPNYDPARHLVTGRLHRDPDTKMWLLDITNFDSSEVRRVELTWFAAGVDWGWQNPGAMVVAGIDKDRNAYIVQQHYMTQKDINWWAGEAEKARKRYGIKRFACDPSRPDDLAIFNKRMGGAGGLWIGKESKIAIGARNDITAGLSVVRERWDKDKLFILRDSLVKKDAARAEASKPTCLEDEIPSYAYRLPVEGQMVKEEPAKDSEAHAADALRYLCMFLDGANWQPAKERAGFALTSYGSMLKHDRVKADMDRAMFGGDDD